MTISSSEPIRSGVYVSNGAATTYAFPFTIFQPEELVVLTRASEAGEWTQLEYGTDYSVTILTAPSTGGTFTLTAPRPNGHHLLALPDVELAQERSFSNQSGMFPAEIEQALDKITVQLRKINDMVRRAPIVDITSPMRDISLGAPVAGRALVWDSEAKKLIAGPNALEIGAVEAAVQQALQVSEEAQQTAAQMLTDIGVIIATANEVRFASAAEFEAATISPNLQQVAVQAPSGEIVLYRRAPGANGPDDLQHPGGSDWAKASLTFADLVAAITDAVSALERVPYQFGVNGAAVLTAPTPGTLAVTYTNRRISWVRLGNFVLFEFSVSGTIVRGTASGAMQIAGFPFAAATFGSGGAVIRAASGINLQYYVGGSPTVPVSIAGFFPAGESYMNISLVEASGANNTMLLPIDRFPTNGAFALNGFGLYEMAA